MRLHTLDLQKVMFTNNLAQFCSDPDANGNTESWGAGPHWQKNKQLDRSPSVGYVPVAYSSQDTIQATADWSGSVAANLQYDLYVYFEITVDNTTIESSHVHLLPGSNGSYAMDGLPTILDDSFADIYGQQAMFEEHFQLTWKLKVGADGQSVNPRDAGVSTSCLYVTYADPGTQSSGQLYHSVVDIGCRAANGQTTEQAVFDKIWEKFEEDSTTGSIDIYSVTIENGAVDPAKATVKDAQGNVTVQGNELYYYGIPSPFGGSVARANWVGNTMGLLQFKDGSCTAWACFLSDVLKAQGLNANLVHIQYQPGPFVRNGVTMTHTMISVDSDAGTHHSIEPAENEWTDHWIVKYNNSYYDSSYGNAYGSGDTGKTAIIHSLRFKYQYDVSVLHPVQGWITQTITGTRNGTEYDPNGPEKDMWMTFDEI